MCQMANHLSKIEYLDMGGCLFGDKPGAPTFDEYASTIVNVFKHYQIPSKTLLIMEPGAALVASPFSYVCSVLAVKDIQTTRLVFTDGSVKHIAPQMNAVRFMSSVQTTSTKIIARQVVSGYTCIENDRFLELIDCQELQIGDTIQIYNTGAYSLSLSPLFIEYYPKVIVKNGLRHKIVREAWDIDEFMQKISYNMNILILSPGRRVEVVEYFKEVFHRDGGLVYTLDMSPYAPALYFGDKYFCVEKDFNHIERYVQNIIFICENYGIKSVISLIDPELVLLSQYQGEFDKFGIKTILSDIRFTESTFDKYVFYQKYKDTIRLIPTVESYSEAHKMIESREWSYPIFAKLRDGSASIGICKIDTEDDFAITRNNDKYIYQPFIEGIEYGVDVYFDLISGELISVFIKRKLAMRAGETDKSISVKSAKILSEILKVGKISGIRGPVDVDVFVSNRGEVFINEINPRFGGGYPHAYQCGVNFMELIMNNLKGIVNKPQFNNYEEDVILLKYSSSYLVKND